MKNSVHVRVFSARTFRLIAHLRARERKRESEKKKTSNFENMHFVEVSYPFCQKIVQLVFSSSSGQTASVHTLHMPKPVITFMFRVFGYMRYTKP